MKRGASDVVMCQQVIMATNRIDILDSALLRPGRIDRKIEFPAPNEEVRNRDLVQNCMHVVE